VLNDINVPIRKGRTLDFAMSSIPGAAAWVDYEADCGSDYLPLWITVPKPEPAREREVDTRRIDLEKFAKSYGKFVAIEGITLEVEVREF
jgi:hypothetical protein